MIASYGVVASYTSSSFGKVRTGITRGFRGLNLYAPNHSKSMNEKGRTPRLAALAPDNSHSSSKVSAQYRV
jgi:hypothetical protein